MKKLLGVALAFSLLLVGCGESKDSADKKTLSVSTNSGYPPYEMIDKDGKLYGFDIDVMNKIAEITGYEIEWKDVAFDGIIESIKTGKTDVGISGISSTPERAKKVDFTDLYYGGEDAINYVLVLKDSRLEKTEDIKGKKIGVQQGTVQDVIVEGIAGEYSLTFEKLSNYTDLVQKLKMKEIDAMVVEKAVASQLTKKNPELAYYQLEAGSEIEGNAIALKKGSKLKKKFDAAIKEMKDSGEMDKLIEKWFVEEK